MNPRPLGISILSVLHMLCSVAVAVVIAVLTTYSETVADALERMGLPRLSTAWFVELALLGALAAVSSVGMWRGARWGWWTATVLYVLAVLRALGGLLQTYLLTRQQGLAVDLPPGTTTKWAIKFSVRTVVSVLVLCYFFKPNVLAFFKLQDMNKGKVAGILLAVILALFALMLFGAMAD